MQYTERSEAVSIPSEEFDEFILGKIELFQFFHLIFLKKTDITVVEEECCGCWESIVGEFDNLIVPKFDKLEIVMRLTND